MRKYALILTAGAMLASAAHADWMLSDYATPAADSAEVNKYYGVQSFQNKASSVTTKVTDGAIALVATKIASDGTEGYTANIGMLHPLDASWSEYDLTGLTGITFKFRNSAKITDYLAVSFGSATYTDAIASAGTVYEVGIKGATNLAASTSFKDASVDILDFATPTWWEAPADFPTIEEVLTKVKNIQFAPKTAYSASGEQNGKACTKCVTPDMTAQTLEIKEITLVGVDQVMIPNAAGVGCQATDGTPLALDALFDDNENDAGGYWFNFSDFDSTLTATDKAKGSSTSAFEVTPGDEFNPGFITLTAGLNKMGVGGTKWHDYAGWADIGTQFLGKSRLNGKGLKAISFHIQATKLDPAIKSLIFKVGIKGVSDTATHQAQLPASAVSAAAGYTFCIRPEDLKQESFVKEKVEADVTKINQLSWEAKITDNKSPAIFKADAVFLLSDVKFFGLTAPELWETTGLLLDPEEKVSVGPRSIAKSAFVASYANGFLSLKGVQGVKSMDVISLDGRKVASFAPSARVALDLPRGTYFLSGKRNGANLVQSFAVLGR